MNELDNKMSENNNSNLNEAGAFMCSFEQAVKKVEDDAPLKDILQFLDPMEEAKFKAYIKERPYSLFEDTLERFKKEKGIISDYELCKKSGLTRDYFYKVKYIYTKMANRDTLWALAIGLGLNIDETEQLFKSCGLSTEGKFDFRETEMERERAIRYFIEKHMTIEEVNKELAEHDMELLGNGKR